MAGSTVISMVSTYVEHLVASRYASHLTFAGFVVLLYDHLLTLGDEIELIWSRPGNIVSIIFLVNRYMTPLVLVVDVYALMLMRANALWGNTIRIRRALIAAFVLYLTSTFALLTAGMFQTVGSDGAFQPA
ncbi:hypothetical protein FRC09_007338 [Ceratobasidium sp. 395]|nr:hypothetical protein FRC09_007338 [Ceratobasidium sp. 395]